MASNPLDPLRARTGEVVGGATGRTLALWAPGLEQEIPTAAVVEVWRPGHELTGRYDSVVSVGGLGTTQDLAGLLRALAGHLGPAGLVWFCEPTIVRQQPTTSPPHDVTTSLWRAGYSVIEVDRAQQRSGWRRHHYCWGRARLTPPTAPPRRWAAPGPPAPPAPR